MQFTDEFTGYHVRIWMHSNRSIRAHHFYTHQPRKSIARAEPEEHGDGGKRAAEYTDRLPATVHHLNTGLRWAPPRWRLPPTYWNFKGLLGIIQHLDLDGHEFSWRRGGRLLSMFQRTDPRILRSPQSWSWSWPLLYLSHDESRLYTVSTRSRERRKIHQKRRLRPLQ